MKEQDLKNNTVQSLIGFAWFLEILFCITGFIIAISLSFSGIDINSIKDIDPVMLIGFLVLFAISAVELTKIPMVKAFTLSRNLKNKAISGGFLLLACVMTFYTMSTGMEQNVNNRDHNLNETKLALLELNEYSQTLDQKIHQLASEKNKPAGLELKKSIKEIENGIADLRLEETRLIRNQNLVEITALEKQIKLNEEASKKANTLYLSKIREINHELQELDKNEQNELSNAAIFKGSIIKRYSERRSNLQEKKLNLSDENKKNIINLESNTEILNNKISLLSKPDASSLNLIDDIRVNIANLQKQKNNLIALSNQEAATNFKQVQFNKENIAKLEAEKLKLEKQILKTRNEFTNLAEKSVIYRLSQKIHGVENPADLKESQVSIVSMFYIFSIALIVSISGPVLAFTALRSKLEEQQDTSSATKRKSMILFRSLLKRLRQPKIVTQTKEIKVEKEVIVEIPVEKKIYEKIEVPVPYEITKYVGVPVPTDPRDLPKKPEDSNGFNSLISNGVMA